MTNREFFNAVIAANLSDDMTAKARDLIAAADKKNGKRAAAQSENRTANVGIANTIAAAMTGGVTYAASEIKGLVSDVLPDISTAKITAVAKVGVAEGIFSVVDGYKVGGKGRAVKGYRLADTADIDEVDED